MLNRFGGRVAGAARPKPIKPGSSSPNLRRCGAALFSAVAAILLLLLSLFLLHNRLSSSSSSSVTTKSRRFLGRDAFSESLIQDIKNLPEMDDLEEQIDDLDDVEGDGNGEPGKRSENSGYFWDHSAGTLRRAFRKGFGVDEGFGVRVSEDRIKYAVTSDDLPLDGEIRSRVAEMKKIEDVLLLNKKMKTGSTSMDWSTWSDKVQRQSLKGFFPLRDSLFRSTMEAINPQNHQLLQDPDSFGLTAMTRGDRIVKKWILNHLEDGDVGKEFVGRRSLKSAIYPDGKNWGYYPGVQSNSGFSEFIEKFLEKGKCRMRFFVVWNSPPWAFTVRHRRGIESILYHHPDACIMVFSETVELDFLVDFAKEGYKVAVVMPNLEELLKHTPAEIFASVWHKWRKIPLYPIHYSELVRLAALYKYGGIYVDSDVIMLKPLDSLYNAIGMDMEQAGAKLSLNGAIMAFEQHSGFIMECLKEFYSTYDEKLLRWNGADLLSRTATKFGKRLHFAGKELEVKIELPFTFFPISSGSVARYFEAPQNNEERFNQEILFQKILRRSTAFHFWNGVTHTLVPEEGSIVERLLNRYCLRCTDLL